MNFKQLFSRSLSAAPARLHFAAHSHHLWPDVSFDAHQQAWQDAALLADLKWTKVMEEVWPEAQGHVARELGTGDPSAIAFSSNTHDFVVRLVTAAPRIDGQLGVLTSDGEFHSARRQLARFEEEGWVQVERVAVEPFDSFPQRFLAAARTGRHQLVLVSQVLFGSGRMFDLVDELAAIGDPDGPWVVVDGYHGFMAIDEPLGERAGRSAFYVAGGYKYAMAGEGCAFLHAPPDFGTRPPVTGWFAELHDLGTGPASVGYAPDGRRFLGATFDPSGLYRFNAVQRMLQDNGLTTKRISEHTSALQEQLVGAIGGTALASAELVNPPAAGAHARFLAFRSGRAQLWSDQLKAKGCVTDVRGDMLRIGFGIYQDERDVERLVTLLTALS